MEPGFIALALITFLAAFVNGALGYGFSSLTVPVGLLFLSNRVLNPALVLVEVFINLYVLFINRATVPAVWKRVYPILMGLLPGVALGSYLLASIPPAWASCTPSPRFPARRSRCCSTTRAWSSRNSAPGLA